MAETEDIPYSVSDHATSEPDEQEDADQPNKSILLEVQQYIDEAIAEHNTMDVLDLSENLKMNPTQQIAVHKLVVNHLRSIKNIVDGKIKELR